MYILVLSVQFPFVQGGYIGITCEVKISTSLNTEGKQFKDLVLDTALHDLVVSRSCQSYEQRGQKKIALRLNKT